ncbi:aarF domain-containing kinase [Trypanosoma rangeli]|uniref:AarF domain-containing kinase n=1 Tax=Trypanosoma rangeli TaxID=5698 RepID=A0A3R7KJM1_TRYRA|nr:aarF domain-containing kinase [Trypanosoma rangeli]RNF08856.1 aarF domain-containing kinase [Trypanosoma rangeli]|eukprot:RNF08856.1 aarF domain-containing kinase [Trypanosoma rangeli]
MVVMSRLYRRSFSRCIGYAVGGTTVATALVLAPPLDAVPEPLLPARVLCEGVGRVCRCVYVAGQIFIDYQWNLHGEDSQELWNAAHLRNASRLVTLAKTNGGLYVKAGQVFANMSHILPRQYCTTMAVLQDAVTSRPFSEVVTTLEYELRRPVEEVFSEIDPTPIAAASLAQVHRGRLRKEQVEVAVKVQYLDIAHRFRGDMRTIQLMLGIAGFFFRGYDLSEILSRLNSTVANELDFTLEADNCKRAGRELRAGGFGSRVVTVDVLPDYTKRRVLTTRLVPNAVKVSDLRGIEALGIKPRTVAAWFYDALAYQLFITGFVHGDPHAGNVLVHRLPNGQPQVVLLDFGLCTELSDDLRAELAYIWTAAVTHDIPSLQKVAQRFGCKDYALFASCFLQHPYELFNAESRVTTKATQEMMRDQVRHKMHEVNDIVSHLPKEYALVLRNIMAAKAINRELREPVNRPLRMLRYSVVATHGARSRWQVCRMLLRAWCSEMFSSLLLMYAKWRHPELMQMLDESLELELSG